MSHYVVSYIRRLAIFVLLFFVIFGFPLIARAQVSGVAVELSSLEVSDNNVSPGQVVSYSVTLKEAENIDVAYLYLNSEAGDKRQVALHNRGEGNFSGNTVVNETWNEGAWECSALQVYAHGGYWGYLRDKRAYPQSGNADLFSGDLLVSKDASGNTDDHSFGNIDFEYARIDYSSDKQEMIFDVQVTEGASSLYFYYEAPDGDTLQVPLRHADGDDNPKRFTGSFSCGKYDQGDIWRCKAVQLMDADSVYCVYLHDARFKGETFADLSFLDAVMCVHDWGEWTHSNAATCIARGAEVRKCVLCGKTERTTTPKSNHVWTSVITDKAPTKDSAGAAHRVCGLCGASEDIVLPALYPFSAYEFVPGMYLVRYYSDFNEAGIVMFRGNPMVRIAGQDYWAALVKGDPGVLSRDDFSVDAAGVLTVIARPGFEGGSLPAGDVNGNGVTNAVDAQIAYDMVVRAYDGFGELPADAWLAADVNDDGFLDAADAFAIQKAALEGWS